MISASIIVALQVYFIVLILKANYAEQDPRTAVLDVYQMNIYTKLLPQNQEIIYVY